MGSFIGHVVPGTFFGLFGIWWLYSVFYRYFYSRRFRNNEYISTSSFDCTLCKRKWPVEPFLKIVAISIGMVGEYLTGFENGNFTHLGNAQHMTMFFFFGFNGLVELAYFKKWELPSHLDYVTATLGFGIEGFLFFNHLHGRPQMDIQVHMFLVYIIMGCVAFTTLEMIYPKQVLFALGRTFCVLFQGTWFYQVGFILYPPFGPAWDTDDHSQMMIVTLLYTSHIAILLVLFFLIGYLISLRVKSLSEPGPLYQLVQTSAEGDESGIKEKDSYNSNGHAKMNGYHSKPLHHLIDSESEDV